MTPLGLFEAEDGFSVSHTLFHDVEIEEAPQRFRVDKGSVAVERAQTLQDLGIEPVDSLSIRGREATVHVISTNDDAQFVAWASLVYLWTAPAGEQFAFLFEGLNRDEADPLLRQLEPLSR